MIYSDKPKLLDAIKALTDEKWSHYEGDDASTIGWDNPENAPSIEELNSKLSELITEWEANQYQRNRSSEYLSWQEQMDMQYWDAKNGTKKWQEAIEAVKTKYPKGE